MKFPLPVAPRRHPAAVSLFPSLEITGGGPEGFRRLFHQAERCITGTAHRFPDHSGPVTVVNRKASFSVFLSRDASADGALSRSDQIPVLGDGHTEIPADTVQLPAVVAVSIEVRVLSSVSGVGPEADEKAPGFRIRGRACGGLFCPPPTVPDSDRPDRPEN
jgi:hypothetical protein